LRTLQSLRETYVALPIDEAVASAIAEIVAIARRAGRQNTWIAATARAHGVAVYSRDGDFDDLAVDVVRV
jgi:predicted nucleic acid-binding protein